MSTEPLIVVGVGASAGGLEAFSQLLSNIPSDLRVAWVCVPGLGSTFEEMLEALPSRITTMVVKEAQPDERVRAGCVYFSSPSRCLTIEDDAFRLEMPSGSFVGDGDIDHFFHAIARSCGRRAVGVMLGRAGDDGAGGLRAIKAAGGLTIAQHPPDDAVADLVLETHEIPSAIKRYLEHRHVGGDDPEAPAHGGQGNGARCDAALPGSGVGPQLYKTPEPRLDEPRSNSEELVDIANLLHSSLLPAIVLDGALRIRRWTPEAHVLLNLHDGHTGRPIHDLNSVCIDEGMFEDAQEVINGLAPVEQEIQDEHGAWYIRRVLPYRTADGRIDGVVVTFSQVTRLKDLTAALTAQREQQRAAADAGVLALREEDFVSVSEHVVRIVSRTLDCPMCKVLELTDDQKGLLLLAGVGWHDGLIGKATVPNDRGSQAGYTLEASGPVVVGDLQAETRFQGPALLTDHAVRSGISVIIFGATGKPYGVLGVHSTEPRAFDEHQVAFVQQMANVLGVALQRLAAIREVDESRRTLQSIIDNAPAAIFAKDLQGRFILSNAAHARALGVSHGEVLGKRDEDLAPSRELAELYRGNDVEVTQHGEPIEFEEHIDIDGKAASFISQKFPLRSAAGEIYAVCGISTDITERKRSEAHLRLVMSELNHRVKNTLASVQALARVTARNAPSMEAFRKAFADRLTSMGVAHSLLTRSDWRGANIGDIIVSELEPRIGARDALEMEGPRLAIKPKSALSLHMAIHEMATNAAKYGALSSHHGRLRVAWRVVSAKEGEGVEITWTERGGPRLEGMKPEGFGSQMIRDMLAYELEGKVVFAYEPEGLNARIWFPLRHADAGAPLPSPAKKPAPPLHLRRATSDDPVAGDEGAGEPAPPLLYVEDNSVIARSMTVFLRELGFEVLGPVATVDAALELLEQHTPEVALLDIDLDGTMVYPVADRLRERNVPFAFVTGYNAEDLPEQHAQAPLFSKPLDLDGLEAWLTED
ncbi:hypothetical protein AY599_18650 [Leptolyngbya valderiana BDU 20041]|nr:hypothetical protein AY599_18650 [Leptolyngbya valderiana BDU 20041]